MGVFDKLEQAQAQQADFQERAEQLTYLNSFLGVKNASARIVLLNAIIVTPPMIFGAFSWVAIFFAISALILLAAIQPNADSLTDLASVGWMQKIIRWTKHWWVGAIFAFFFLIGGWGNLFDGAPHYLWNTWQGLAFGALSAFAWYQLKLGGKTKAMIEMHDSLGVKYVWSWW